jgi:hypothetical protein
MGHTIPFTFKLVYLYQKWESMFMHFSSSVNLIL